MTTGSPRDQSEMTAEELCQRYSLAAPHVLEDPWPSFEALKAQCPVHFDDSLTNPVWTMSRREDVMRALLDTETYSNRGGPGVGYSTGAGMASEDPPEHDVYRRMVQRWFTPKAARDLEPFMYRTADELIDGFSEQREGNLRTLFAEPFPLIALSELMGFALTEDERAQVGEWARTIVLSLVYPENPEAAVAGKDFKEFAAAEIVRRRAASGEQSDASMMEHISKLRMADGELLPEDEAGYIVAHLLLAGAETSVNLITNALHRLLEDGGARWARFREEPELAANVVEESLRFDPPVLGDHRTSTREVTEHHTVIPENAKVMMLYGPANRDDEVFDRAHQFVMDRPLQEARKHLAFSYGIHFCLGAHLARVEARIALEKIVERLPNLRLNGEPTRVETPMFWARGSLPVAW